MACGSRHRDWGLNYSCWIDTIKNTRPRIIGLARKFGVDRAALLVIMGRGWGVVDRLVTLVLITKFMTAEIQGFYYTFASVLSLGIFFELGLGIVLTQYFSHEAAFLQIAKGGCLSGDDLNLRRFRSILQQSFRWYIVLSFLVLAGVGIAGHVFFSQKPIEGVDWTAAWWGYVLLSALSAPLQPFISAIEGIGLVAKIQMLRLISAVTGGLLLWTALYSGAQLYAVYCLPFASLVAGISFIGLEFPALFREACSRTATAAVHWWSEIWPMQWRIALSWISGYFIYQLFTPILFRFHGPAIAGQMGMGIALMSAVGTINYALVGTKAPRFGHLIAKREYDSLDRLFIRVTSLAVVVTVLAGLMVYGVIAAVNAYTHYGARFLPLWQLSLLLASGVLNSVVSAQAIYLRAHKREPFMWLSIGGGLLAGGVVFLGGMRYSSAGQSIGFLCTTAIGLFWAAYVFQRCRREWHTSPGVT